MDHHLPGQAGRLGPRARAPRSASAAGAWRALAASALALALAACGAAPGATVDGPSPGGSTAAAPTPEGTAPDASIPGASIPGAAAAGQGAGSSIRAERYCEVLLVNVVEGVATAEVNVSFPLNDCPAALWERLDAAQIAADEGVSLAVLNGPRYWLMDRIEKDRPGPMPEEQDFGGIGMYRQASVEIGSLAAAAVPYVPREVDRSTVFTFDAGQTVYELTTPDGTTYVMQSWSQQKDPALDEADLAGLGARLQLPAGWTYGSRTLESTLEVVTTSTPARVLQDDLGNSYSQRTDG